MEHHHLRTPHYYLPYIGVRPELCNQGLGSALFKPILDNCDREQLPAYLEATNPSCARLYRRLGFRTTKEIRPFGAPPVELMLRGPA